tara:strand:+ start:2213 stop:2629 length:417 start_codon:yes stop_codon:yes gene_type:complete
MTAAEMVAIRAILEDPVTCDRGCDFRATHEWSDFEHCYRLCETCAEEHECTDDDRLMDWQTPERAAIAALLGALDTLQVSVDNARVASAEIERDRQARLGPSGRTVPGYGLTPRVRFVVGGHLRDVLAAIDDASGGAA